MPSPRNVASNHGTHEDFGNKEYYALFPNFEGNARLALQHYIWRQALGFSIHPSIPRLPDSACVADIACGTGLWLIDVADQLGPAAELHGFDVNTGQAPAKPWLPSNVSIHHWSVYADVPPEAIGRFDLVHLRLVSLVIKDNDPRAIMRNACKMLKPGGYLQWDEYDARGTHVVRAYPDLESPAVDRWCAWLRNPKKEYTALWDDYWVHQMVNILQENGFRETGQYDLAAQFMQHMELARFQSDQLLMMSAQYARTVFAQGQDASSELLAIVGQAAKDVEKGAVLVMPPLCWVAQKVRLASPQG